MHICQAARAFSDGLATIMPVSRHDIPRLGHPGKGRRKAKYTTKGRQVDPAARDEVRALLGAAPRRRDLLIEHLHVIQDT